MRASSMAAWFKTRTTHLLYQALFPSPVAIRKSFYSCELRQSPGILNPIYAALETNSIGFRKNTIQGGNYKLD